ncbi:MAG: hypothetical protein ABR981_04730, partial [Candidatus Micrarchaeaceae archaeon]
GDRGGDMILRGLLNICDINFLVKAPDGKEVEELTRKDIIKALRAKIPIEQVIPRLKSSNGHIQNNNYSSDQPQQRERAPQQQDRNQQMEQQQRQQQQRVPPNLSNKEYEEKKMPILSPAEISRKILNKEKPKIEIIDEDRPGLGIKDWTGQEPEGVDAIPTIGKQKGSSNEADPKYVDALTELHNTLRGRLYDKDGKLISEVPIRELIQEIQDANDIDAIVFDGIITQRLIELANKRGIREVYGIRAGQISRMFDSMLLYTKEQGKL